MVMVASLADRHGVILPAKNVDSGTQADYTAAGH